MKAWWFGGDRLGYGDERKPVKGRTHTVGGPPMLCEHGLHASIRPLDALTYARGTNIFRVDLGGEIVRGEDKIAATHRRYLWKVDGDAVLRKFARLCALDVLGAWDAPDVVVQYLKTGDESLRQAAHKEAYSAADPSARSADLAARSAARSAYSAAYAAADSAAYSAAYAAADPAAYSAARPLVDSAAYAWARLSARKRQNGRLYRMILGARK